MIRSDSTYSESQARADAIRLPPVRRRGPVGQAGDGGVECGSGRGPPTMRVCDELYRRAGNPAEAHRDSAVQDARLHGGQSGAARRIVTSSAGRAVGTSPERAKVWTSVPPAREGSSGRARSRAIHGKAVPTLRRENVVRSKEIPRSDSSTGSRKSRRSPSRTHSPLTRNRMGPSLAAIPRSNRHGGPSSTRRKEAFLLADSNRANRAGPRNQREDDCSSGPFSISRDRESRLIVGP